MTRKNPVPKGRLIIPQDEVLGRFARQEHLREHRTPSFPLQPSIRDCSCFPYHTQDFILGYFQSSLTGLNHLTAKCILHTDFFRTPPGSWDTHKGVLGRRKAYTMASKGGANSTPQKGMTMPSTIGARMDAQIGTLVTFFRMSGWMPN
jgi:hypothetical protein